MPTAPTPADTYVVTWVEDGRRTHAVRPREEDADALVRRHAGKRPRKTFLRAGQAVPRVL